MIIVVSSIKVFLEIRVGDRTSLSLVLYNRIRALRGPLYVGSGVYGNLNQWCHPSIF